MSAQPSLSLWNLLIQQFVILGFYRVSSTHTCSSVQEEAHLQYQQNILLVHTFLGLLAKIKCSICSLEFDNSNGGHCPPCYLTYFSGGLPNSSACTAGLAAWPWHCTTALAEHPLNQLTSGPVRNTLLNYLHIVQISISPQPVPTRHYTVCHQL